ncbi:MAG: RNA-binding S4 domain-containing protein [Anaeromicrobium sp.]|jgi:ribosomal 50S subunit-recycling heat shock protein|uniref:RNA-binding S4 domain-containing protein n=1 Tax=Anaeromicrobium sp. TaxID=1929132 RepID=UPI0025E8EC3F|nr:RNA-binding S4 domain-containing protein [Anaeromicrobium sp.]MCT4594049.1 RNA-binding S4 domain-containing protein [Anaeromicrobium sp.]
MRLDKFLKNSRLIKRRTVAKEACEQGRVKINDKLAKPSSIVNINDNISITYGERESVIKVLELLDHVTKETSKTMYEVIK